MQVPRTYGRSCSSEFRKPLGREQGSGGGPDKVTGLEATRRKQASKGGGGPDESHAWPLHWQPAYMHHQNES